jgi:hypothetical protein
MGERRMFEKGWLEEQFSFFLVLITPFIDPDEQQQQQQLATDPCAFPV